MANPKMANDEISTRYNIPYGSVQKIRKENNILPPEKTLGWKLKKNTKKTKYGCWNWTGFKDKAGYGRVMEGGRKKYFYAHQAAWIVAGGSIPKGAHVLHKCDNRKCINPKHLYLGTYQDNIRDRDNRDRGGRRKLKRHQIRAIRYMAKRGIKHKRIADYFCITV